MAGPGSVRSVFVPSRISPATLPAAAPPSDPARGQHPPAPEANAAPSAPADGQDAPAALPATPPIPTGALGDAPKTVEHAVALMHRYLRALAGAFGRGRGLQDDLYSIGKLAVVHSFQTFREDCGASFRGYAWKNAKWKIVAALRVENYETRHVRSGDAPLSDDVDLPLFAALPAKQPAPQIPGMGHAEARLRQAIPKLRGRQRTVVELLLEGRTQQEIAAAFGVSCQAVQQIAAKAFVHLRRRLTTGYIVERLDRPAENPAEIAAVMAKAGPTAPPEETSGMLASSWPGSSERIPGVDYGTRYWRPAARPAESPQENEPHDPRE